jgi:hypothetical protein
MGPLVAAYVDMLDKAYRRPRGPDGDSHSLLGNLETVPPELWDALPTGAERSIRDLVLHVGSCKYMYDDYAFHAGSMRWDAPPAWPGNSAALAPGELLQWLAEGHAALRASVVALSDASIDDGYRTNWGEIWPARDIIRVMIEHDIYHAGEINHLRSLLQHSDRWAYAGA